MTSDSGSRSTPIIPLSCSLGVLHDKDCSLNPPSYSGSQSIHCFVCKGHSAVLTPTSSSSKKAA